MTRRRNTRRKVTPPGCRTTWSSPLPPWGASAPPWPTALPGRGRTSPSSGASWSGSSRPRSARGRAARRLRVARPAGAARAAGGPGVRGGRGGGQGRTGGTGRGRATPRPPCPRRRPEAQAPLTRRARTPAQRPEVSESMPHPPKPPFSSGPSAARGPLSEVARRLAAVAGRQGAPGGQVHAVAHEADRAVAQQQVDAA
jgi:hypothetical protein